MYRGLSVHPDGTGRMAGAAIPQPFQLPKNHADLLTELLCSTRHDRGETHAIDPAYQPNARDDETAVLPAAGLTSFARILEFDVYLADDLDAVSDLWQSFEGVAELTPFQNYQWVSRWYHDRGKSRIDALKLLFVYDAGILRMIVPMAVEHIAGLPALVWLAHGVNDYNAPLVDPDWLTALGPDRALRLWHRLIGAVDNVSVVKLTKQSRLIGGAENPFFNAKSGQWSCNAHFIDLGGNWADFYVTLRGSKSRRRLREKERKLKKIGQVRFRQARSEADKNALIRTLINWKSAQLNATGARNPFNDDELQSLLHQVSGHVTADRLLRVHALEVAGRPAAISIVLVQGGTMNLFMTGYDETAFRSLSAGTILQVKLMELAVRAGLRVFDFSAGDEAYKAQWSTQQMDMSYSVYGRGLAGRLIAGIVKAQIDAKRLVKSNDFLMRGLQAANLRVTALRAKLKKPGPDRGGDLSNAGSRHAKSSTETFPHNAN